MVEAYRFGMMGQDMKDIGKITERMERGD